MAWNAFKVVGCTNIQPFRGYKERKVLCVGAEHHLKCSVWEVTMFFDAGRRTDIEGQQLYCGADYDWVMRGWKRKS
jgi:hypothetical protein